MKNKKNTENYIQRIDDDSPHTSTKGRELGLKEVSVHMGMFDFGVNFVMGDYNKIGEYVAWKFDDKDFNPTDWDMGYEPLGKCFFRKGFRPIIWIPKKPRIAREYATLSHECLHAIFLLFEWAGMPVNRSTEEVMAHAQAHLVSTILENL